MRMCRRAGVLLTSAMVLGAALGGCGPDDDDDASPDGASGAAGAAASGGGVGGTSGSDAGTGRAGAEPEPVCTQGDTRACLGPGQCPGAQECTDNGTWTSCDCGDNTGGTGGSAGGAGSETGGTVGSAGSAGSGGATAGSGGASAGNAGVAGGAETAGSAGSTGAAGSGGATAGSGGASAGNAGVAGDAGTAGSAGSAGATAGVAGMSGSAGAAGATGSAGAAGSEGTDARPSCASMADIECNGESCCTSIVLPAGSYPMGRGTEDCTDCTDGCPPGLSCYVPEQPEHVASVSRFALDKYEVTVGRFRAFVEAGAGTQLIPPAAASGQHPEIADSGWDSGWDSSLAADQATLISNLHCVTDWETWTDTAGANEAYPMNCVTWFEALAFCIWDGGRLPTEAEWEYAAVGGDENRVFAWGDVLTATLPVNYADTAYSPFTAVGSYPAGNGRWGHADLAGSIAEWTLDWYANDWYTTTQSGCADCANLTDGTHRVLRGGHWNSNANGLRAVYRSGGGDPTERSTFTGWRCATIAP